MIPAIPSSSSTAELALLTIATERAREYVHAARRLLRPCARIAPTGATS